MRMIPKHPRDTRSSAERKVFDQLRCAFQGADQHGWFAMHSLNLPRHEYKRFGEIDFVVCGPDGLFVLEVKGGGVSCNDGIWETTDRYGENYRLTESPFVQAEGALHGLRNKLPADLKGRFVVGYGVVLPDSTRFAPSAEWDRQTLADANDFKEFERWLSKLIKYWRAKLDHPPVADAGTIKELQRFLRPNFETVQPLHIVALDIESAVVRMTEDQFRVLDTVEANDRVLCDGGAGTGKTMLALELARRWAADGKLVALTCHSPWLKAFLETKAVPGLTVCLANAIKVSARRASVQKFDALIVDEGQDVLNLEMLDSFDQLLEGGVERGRWCFFYDVNNQSGLCGRYESVAYEYLRATGAVRVPLKNNCRNTLPILEYIQGTLGADVGVSGVGQGPEVRITEATGASEIATALSTCLATLLETDGFSPADIVILSPVAYNESFTSLLPDEIRMKVSVLDSFSPHNASVSRIGFARIADFKGLESKVVVLVDLPDPVTDVRARTLHYVGMSRANTLLCVICGHPTRMER